MDFFNHKMRITLLNGHLCSPLNGYRSTFNRAIIRDSSDFVATSCKNDKFTIVYHDGFVGNIQKRWNITGAEDAFAIDS